MAVTWLPGFVDEQNWKCFVNSTYDRKTKKWSLKKVPHVDLVAKPTAK